MSIIIENSSKSSLFIFWFIKVSVAEQIKSRNVCVFVTILLAMLVISKSGLSVRPLSPGRMLSCRDHHPGSPLSPLCVRTLPPATHQYSLYPALPATNNTLWLSIVSTVPLEILFTTSGSFFSPHERSLRKDCGNYQHYWPPLETLNDLAKRNHDLCNHDWPH